MSYWVIGEDLRFYVIDQCNIGLSFIGCAHQKEIRVDNF
jgi:hypothetical protein